MQDYLLEEKSKFLAYFKYQKQDLKILKVVFVTEGKKATNIYQLKFELNLDKNKNKQKFNFSLSDFIKENNKVIKMTLLIIVISIITMGLIGLTLFFF